MATLATPEALTTTGEPKRTYLIGLREKIDYALVGLLGNRITTLGAIAMAYKTANDSGQHAAQGRTIAAFCAASGPFLLAGTQLGLGTLLQYHRGKKHIEKNGELDPRYIEAIIKNENRAIFGYCPLQGVYLAARNSDNPEANLKTFFEAKKKYSNNIIPNF